MLAGLKKEKKKRKKNKKKGMTVYENFEKDKELVSIPLNLQEVNACKIYSITFSVSFLKFIIIVF